jgi:hypothetical protein
LICFWVVFDEPKISLCKDWSEVVVGEFLHLRLGLACNITWRSKGFSQEWFNNNRDILMIFEDEAACPESPEEWWDQNDIGFDIFDMISGFDALVNAFFSDVAVEKVWVVLDPEDESLMFAQLFPNVWKVMLNSVIVRGNIELGFGMADHSNFGLFFWNVGLALHECCFI